MASMAMSTADAKIAPVSAKAANHSTAADDGANDRIRRGGAIEHPNHENDGCNDGQHHK